MNAKLFALMVTAGSVPSFALAQDSPSQSPDAGIGSQTLDVGDVVIVEDDAPDPPTTATESVVDAKVVANSPAKTTDELLRHVGGLHISQHGAEGKAQQFFLRGFDAVHGADLEITVGGILVNELSNVHGHGYADLGFIVPEVVSQVRARKGSFALDQGTFGTAGSVDLKLGVAERGARASYEAGTTNRHRVVGIYAPDDAEDETFLALAAVSDDGFGQNRSSRRMNALGQYRFRLDKDTTIDIAAGAYSADFGEPGVNPLRLVESGALGFDDAASPDTDARSQRAFASATYEHLHATHRFLTTATFMARRLELEENFTGFLVNPEQGDGVRQAHGSISGRSTLRYEHYLTPTVTLRAGGSAMVDRVDQSERAIDVSGMPWRDNRSVAATHIIGDARGGVTLNPADWVRLDAGLRLDVGYFDATDNLSMQNGSDVLATLSPRLSTTIKTGDTGKLFFSYGRGLRMPEARVVAGDASLMNEEGTVVEAEIATSDAVEVGARGELGPGLEAGGALFGIWLGNEVIFDHTSATTLALGASRRLGVEAFASYAPTSWMTLRGDATFTDARFADTGDPVQNAPRLVASLAANVFQRRGWRAGALFRVIGPRPLAFAATGQTQAVLDLSVGHRFDRFEVRAVIDNATASRFREAEFNYASYFDRSRPRSALPTVHYSPGRPLSGRVVLTSFF